MSYLQKRSIYAQALGGKVFRYRELDGGLEVDLVVEEPSGSWTEFEVKLRGDLVDEAAAALVRLPATRVSRAPSVLAVITGIEYSDRRSDGVWVIPLGCLGP